jgi:hypothetical protein
MNEEIHAWAAAKVAELVARMKALADAGMQL